jgi:hypothetical protein
MVHNAMICAIKIYHLSWQTTLSKMNKLIPLGMKNFISLPLTSNSVTTKIASNMILAKLLLLLGLIVINFPIVLAQVNTKPRTIVTTDGEIDDVDSFIRMLLYADEFRLEGLIYSSSMWHYKGDGKGTEFISEMDMTKKMYGKKTNLRWPGTQWMQALIDDYEKVYPTLIIHSKGYPEPDRLRQMIKVGNIDFEGEMEQITEGSEWIKSRLLDDDPQPIYIQVWGGTNTLARALASIEQEYKGKSNWKKIKQKVIAKTIIYAILDQDATYKKYISVHWPEIKIYYNSSQFWCLAYLWKRAVPAPLAYVLEGSFMGPHIIQFHGPLLRNYYSYGDGQVQAGDDEHIHGDESRLKNAQWGSFKKYDFISEGDSPAFLHLINVGLQNLENPHYGGWGGRLVPSPQNPNRWEDGHQVNDWNPYTDTLDRTYPQIRWLEAIQKDFAGRADWCTQSYAEANHAPSIKVSGVPGKVKAGQSLQLQAQASDPDGDSLQYRWWQYHEVDSYPGKLPIEKNGQSTLTIQIPDDIKKKETIHLILEVTDQAIHPMTRYHRVVLTAK